MSLRAHLRGEYDVPVYEWPFYVLEVFKRGYPTHGYTRQHVITGPGPPVLLSGVLFPTFNPDLKLKYASDIPQRTSYLSDCMGSW